MKPKYETYDGKVVIDIYKSTGILPRWIRLAPIDERKPSKMRVKLYGYDKAKKDLTGKE